MTNNALKLNCLKNRTPFLWRNPSVVSFSGAVLSRLELSPKDFKDAHNRWNSFRPMFKKLFPLELEKDPCWDGSVKSELRELGPEFNKAFKLPTKWHTFMKMDSHLQVCGSVKARGGLYEVFKTAQSWAEDAGIPFEPENSDRLREHFAQHSYEICVGSTGNLGMSIGLGARALGIEATIHMSSDAKAWKKALLRSKGANVVEHEGDYGQAVEQGRKEASTKERCHFVCDETSRDLMLGYSTVALELRDQLEASKRRLGRNKPLICYIPCGVGGAPAGVLWGLKTVFGTNNHHVYVVFAEPVESPCVTLGLLSTKHDQISVRDVGLTNKTEADGLAVGRASGLACRMSQNLLHGSFTVDDESLFANLKKLHKSTGFYIEPSCCAALSGPGFLLEEEKECSFLNREALDLATHVLWATGGSLVPEEEVEHHLKTTRVDDKWLLDAGPS